MKSKTSKNKSKKSLRSSRKHLDSLSSKKIICVAGEGNIADEYVSHFKGQGIAVLELKNISSIKSSSEKISCVFELSLIDGVQKKKNLEFFDKTLPNIVPIVTNAITSTVLSQAQEIVHKERLVGIAAFPTIIDNKLAEIAPSLYTSQETADNVVKFFSEIKKECVIVEDSIGMVMPRVLCQIINEALFVVQNDIANPKDIDIAMKLAAHYPHGPIEWGERIGFKNIVSVLDALYHHYREERYRVAPLLQQMAVAGRFWS